MGSTISDLLGRSQRLGRAVNNAPASLSADGSRLVYLGEPSRPFDSAGPATFWDSAEPRESSPGGAIATSVALSPDGDSAILGSPGSGWNEWELRATPGPGGPLELVPLPPGARLDGLVMSLGVASGGDVVVFESDASHLVPDDHNEARDVFLLDRRTGVLERVVPPSGIEARQGAMNPSLSADGRFLAFDSSSPEFRGGEGIGWREVFLLDRSTGQVTGLSGVEGHEYLQGPCFKPSLSADGRWVAYLAQAPEMHGSQPLGQGWQGAQVVLQEVGTGQRIFVEAEAGGRPAGSQAREVSVSGDGSFVAYSQAGLGTSQIRVYDRATGWSGSLPPGPEGAAHTVPVLSADGSTVAFQEVDDRGAWLRIVPNPAPRVLARALEQRLREAAPPEHGGIRVEGPEVVVGEVRLPRQADREVAGTTG